MFEVSTYRAALGGRVKRVIIGITVEDTATQIMNPYNLCAVKGHRI